MRVSRRLIAVTGLRDVVERRVPVLCLDSGVHGPVVWLTACIHGDEPGGTAIVHDVFSRLRKTGLRCGRVHAFPLINSLGFENASRYLNVDREDLNRCFPGDPDGTMGERIAARLYSAIRVTAPSLVIDLHNDWIQSVPYILLEPAHYHRSNDVRARCRELARATGRLIVDEATATDPIDGTLTAALVADGIPAFTIEAGGACGVVEEGVASGAAGVLAVLHELGMCEPDAPVRRSRTPISIFRYTDLPRCTSSGLVRFSVAPGDRVEAGQVLARVYSAFGSCEETLRAQSAGFVLGLSDHARAMPGCEIVASAIECDDPDASPTRRQNRHPAGSRSRRSRGRTNSTH